MSAILPPPTLGTAHRRDVTRRAKVARVSAKTSALLVRAITLHLALSLLACSRTDASVRQDSTHAQTPSTAFHAQGPVRAVQVHRRISA
jgi:hypothetical protein